MHLKTCCIKMGGAGMPWMEVLIGVGKYFKTTNFSVLLILA